MREEGKKREEGLGEDKNDWFSDSFQFQPKVDKTWKRLMTGKSREIHLKEWEEIIGVLKGVVEEEDFILVQFDNFHLIFNKASREAKILKEELDGVMIGNKISILKTDIVEKPVIVKGDIMRQDSPAPRLHHHKGKSVA